MKHLFYLIYVLSFSGAVFVTGVFMGQFLERYWSAREQRAKQKVLAQDHSGDPVGIHLGEAHTLKTGEGK